MSLRFLPVRKLRTSVQEAYAARDAAVSKADNLEKEMMGLRLDVASLRDEAIASSISMERMLSEERRASSRVQPQPNELDAEQKTSKFRVCLDTAWEGKMDAESDDGSCSVSDGDLGSSSRAWWSTPWSTSN
jgi:hypothetical protein